MKKMCCFSLVGVALICLFSPAQAADFPRRNLSGIVMWGAGGATDNVARAVTPLVEKLLGKKILLKNKPGATGVVSTQWVYNQPSDGYTLLYGSEHPQMYRVLEMSQLDYRSFFAVNVLVRDVGVVVSHLDTPWKTLQELFEDAKKNPGQIKMGSTGPVGLSYLAAAMYRSVNHVTFNPTPFGGEGPAMAALQGGHVQFSTIGMITARGHIRAGRVRALSVVSEDPVPGLENVPPITSIYPAYSQYLPWGPFHGVWVKRDVPEDAKQMLVDAFLTGANDPKFQDFVRDIGAVYVGLYGDEAEKFLKRWRSVTCWLLYEAGGARISPEKFGIPKP